MPDDKKDKQDIPERADFKIVVMPRDKLIEKMRENRAAHEEAFNQAMEGFSLRAKQLLEESLDRIRKGSKEAVFVNVPQPESHLADYDAYIQALEVQPFEEVRLPMDDWRCYYRDEWSWKRNWTTSNSDYVALASPRPGR